MDTVNLEFVKEFDESFCSMRNRRIVLYGIGYRTGALIEALNEEYNFIGLMDRDKENIGKFKFGYEILDEHSVIEKADCIIIISVSFYDVIYNRISHLETENGIEIFFPNGKRASEVRNEFEELNGDDFRQNIDIAKQKIDEADVVSFDIFDTLLMRKVLNPDNVFDVVGVRNHRISDFKNKRKEAYSILANRNPTIDEVYQKFQELTGLSDEDTESYKVLEVETEQKLICTRERVVELFRYAKRQAKNVCLVSDMYLSTQQLWNILKMNDIDIDKEKIFVSCELRMSKETGEMWQYVSSQYVGEKILHFGDDAISDGKNAQKFGITSFMLLSAKELLRHSVYNRFLKYENGLANQIVLGLVAAKLFNSPFAIDRMAENGDLLIKNEQELGYLGYGCLIEEYLLFILKQCKKNEIEKLFFMARDGWLLKQDFEYLQQILGDYTIHNEYLKISRVLIRKTCLTNREQIKEFAQLPYTGGEKSFYYNRFGIDYGDDQNCIEAGRNLDSSIQMVLQEHESEIIKKSKKYRENYLNYLENEIGEFTCSALIDFGYSGSTQYWLSKLLSQGLVGFYLLADMSEENNYNMNQKKFSYVYDTRDLRGKNSPVNKCFSILESVFTSDCGTYLGCDEKGEFETSKTTRNNDYFETKQAINEGIKEFIYDMNAILGQDVLNISFTRNGGGEELLVTIFGKYVSIPKEILKTFYTDDCLNYNKDVNIFDI